MKRCRLICLAIALAGLLAAPGAAQAKYQKTKPVGWGPRTSKAAAKLVNRNHYEPRPMNYRDNHRVPGKKLLRAWRKRSDMPYKQFVDGRFKGTTDEIIQWASLKWAVVESWWDMDVRGDNGDSFGLYQIRRPYHCRGKCKIVRYFTAFNADYYGAIIRSYYDGTQTWLNTVTGNGKKYRAGDLQGSMGAWYSGRWWGPPDRPVEPYLEAIAQRKADKTWRHADFIAYGLG